LLAEAHGKLGQIDKGLAAITEALVMVDKTGQHYWDAELYRLRGELTLKSQLQGRRRSRGLFPQGHRHCPGQSAKSLELRPTMSLVRLWREQGKREEARQMLAEIYGWFTEGFEALDLTEAKALLTARTG